MDPSIHTPIVTIRAAKPCLSVIGKLVCAYQSIANLNLQIMYISNHPIFKANNAINILLLPTNKGIEIIDCLSVIRVEAISNYCKLFFTNGKTLVVAKVLAWFDEKLSNKGFVRIHRSHIVNMQFILRLQEEKKAEVILKNYYSIPVSRREKQHCKDTITKFYDGPRFATEIN